MSVGARKDFYRNIDRSQEQVWLDKNRRMIQKFKDAKVPIFAVEYGNEEMFHVPQHAYFPANKKYSALEILFGVPKIHSQWRAEIDGYYDNYVRIYKLHADMVAKM
jgi:hypothetical protein